MIRGFLLASVAGVALLLACTGSEDRVRSPDEGLALANQFVETLTPTGFEPRRISCEFSSSGSGGNPRRDYYDYFCDWAAYDKRLEREVAHGSAIIRVYKDNGRGEYRGPHP